MDSELRLTQAPPADLLWPLNPVEQKHAPRMFYVAGHAEWLSLRPKVAVVGSRHASDEGRRRARRLAQELARHDVIVVSGLADGIDVVAHTATLEVPEGRTIAVVGTPLDTTYPTTHRALHERLAREHAVVSQFPTGTPVRRENFPQRNRTMALIVDASVIVEAGDGSGTLSQGWEALRLGRPLFILKSVFDREALTWPSEMLRHGAIVLTTMDELFERLPSEATDPLALFA